MPISKPIKKQQILLPSPMDFNLLDKRTKESILKSLSTDNLITYLQYLVSSSMTGNKADQQFTIEQVVEGDEIRSREIRGRGPIGGVGGNPGDGFFTGVGSNPSPDSSQDEDSFITAWFDKNRTIKGFEEPNYLPSARTAPAAYNIAKPQYEDPLYMKSPWAASKSVVGVNAFSEQRRPLTPLKDLTCTNSLDNMKPYGHKTAFSQDGSILGKNKPPTAFPSESMQNKQDYYSWSQKLNQILVDRPVGI